VIELEEEEEDNMEYIDPSNILPPGRRTRGKHIDFAKANAELPHEAEEDEEEDEEYISTETVAEHDGAGSDVEMGG
jgi:hypothetical protein